MRSDSFQSSQCSARPKSRREKEQEMVGYIERLSRKRPENKGLGVGGGGWGVGGERESIVPMDRLAGSTMIYASPPTQVNPHPLASMLRQP